MQNITLAAMPRIYLTFGDIKGKLDVTKSMSHVSFGAHPNLGNKAANWRPDWHRQATLWRKITRRPRRNAEQKTRRFQ
jgi:hypothetical protein